MRVTYNGQTSPSGMITLTGVPNILTIESDPAVGRSATLVINTINTSFTEDTEYYITINGITVRSTDDWNNSTRFYVKTGASSVAMAASLTKALRTTSLIVDYNIYQETSGNNLVSRVVLEAKNAGGQYNITYDSNISEIWTFTTANGATADQFVNNQFSIDIYSGDNYITTLSKLYYKESISFNLSNILNSISEYDRLTPYSFIIYASEPSSVSTISRLSGIYSSIGYMCNQGESFLRFGNNDLLAQNVNRGEDRDLINKTILYTYQPSIPISLFSTDTTVSLTINYVNTNGATLHTESQSYPVNGYVMSADIPLNREWFTESKFIDINIPGIGNVRYNIIKPLDATAKCQRILYHNSYGGISFFDFTGQRTESHKVDNETYDKNTYDYYKDDFKESTKIYSKESEITVTVKSHLMEADARWQFNDLLGSFDVWTNINGVDYKIIIQSCSVEETTTGVWEATVTYTYSYI